MIYTVSFAHPLVGNKGDVVYLTVDAKNEQEAIKKAKADEKFAKAVNHFSDDDYPIKENYYKAFLSPLKQAGEFLNIEGDPRL